MDFINGIVRFLQEGGVFIYPIAFILVLGIVIAVERWWFLRSVYAVNQRAMAQVQPAVAQADTRRILQLAESADLAIVALPPAELAQALDLLGERCGIVGTLGNGFYGALELGRHTTPDPIGVQATLADMKNAGARAVAMEVSSHGLHQGRVAALAFDVAVLTNLSRDHLDYHADMEDYFAAKMRLFDEVVAPGGAAVIWRDGNGWAERAVEHASKRGLRVFLVGGTRQSSTLAGTLNGSVDGEGEGIRLVARTPGSLGQELEIEYGGTSRRINLPLIGAYQAANAGIEWAAARLLLDAEGEPPKTLEDTQIGEAAGPSDRVGHPMLVIP